MCSWMYNQTKTYLFYNSVFFWFNEMIEAMGGRFVLLVYDETWIDFVINE